MLDDYLRKQNRFLYVISILLFITSLFVGCFIFINGHPLLALSQFIIVLVNIGGNVHIITENIKYADKWGAINEIEHTALYYNGTEEGVRTSIDGVGNLDFKFTRDANSDTKK
jgi:hypothetical protein